MLEIQNLFYIRGETASIYSKADGELTQGKLLAGVANSKAEGESINESFDSGGTAGGGLIEGKPIELLQSFTQGMMKVKQSNRVEKRV